MPERRKHRRVYYILKAGYESDCANQEGFVTNLSKGGVFLSTEALVPVGAAVRIQIELPWKLGRTIAEAKVVWRIAADGTQDDRPGLGLAFTYLSPPEKKRLQAYMKEFDRLVSWLDKAEQEEPPSKLTDAVWRESLMDTRGESGGQRGSPAFIRMRKFVEP